MAEEMQLEDLEAEVMMRELVRVGEGEHDVGEEGENGEGEAEGSVESHED